MSAIEKNIHFLVENQFPHLFKTEGENLVRFATEYFKWLENNQHIAFSNVQSNVAVSVSNNIVSGNGTSFESYFSNGETIAIYRNNESYDIFTIETVNSDEQIVLDSV